MSIEQEIEMNTKLQDEVVKKLRETKKECNEHPYDYILLFKCSLLMKHYDLYNEIIIDLKKKVNAYYHNGFTE